jgi:uncharacterized membrane protein
VVDDEYFVYIARFLTVIFATLVPGISIVVLYFIPTLAPRLGAVLGFSFFTAAMLALFTTAKPAEIFAITAA